MTSPMSRGPSPTPARRRSAGRVDSAAEGTRATTPDVTKPDVTKEEYERLSELRYALRRFARSTELEARHVGITPQQYLLLLALKGFPGRDWANITELAERLQIRHNAVIALLNRVEARALVARTQDADRTDRRVVQIRLTPQGEQLLTAMAGALRDERSRMRSTLEAVLGPGPADGPPTGPVLAPEQDTPPGHE